MIRLRPVLATFVALIIPLVGLADARPRVVQAADACAVPRAVVIRGKDVILDQCYDREFENDGSDYVVHTYYTEDAENEDNLAQCTDEENAVDRCEHALTPDGQGGAHAVAVKVATKFQAAAEFSLDRDLPLLAEGETEFELFIAEDPKNGWKTSKGYWTDDDGVEAWTDEYIQQNAVHELQHLMQEFYNDGVGFRQWWSEGFARTVEDRTHAELELTDQAAVRAFLASEKPDQVYLAAAKVGGIHANNVYRAQFLYENLMIQNNVIDSAYRNGVKKLLFLGSSCIYPKMAPQPLKEESLLTGLLEQTNEPYAIAKIAGIKMAESYRRQYGVNYISAMPTNLYGPNDNYDLATSHVLPALIRKAHEARERGDAELVVWGSGRPLREFLYVDDMADACVFLMESGISEGLFNVGTGSDVSIRELAQTVMDVVGFQGRIVFDASKPDGTPRKLLDVGRLRALGWEPSIELRDGLERTYQWFLDQVGGDAGLRGVATGAAAPTA